MATANVGTLHPSEERLASTRIAGTLLLGKVQILERQFNEAGLDVIGVQEGRARETSRKAGLHYDMLVGAADSKGGSGCQIWVDRRLGFEVSEFVVVSPRMIYATGRCRHDARMLQFVCAHAPTELAAPEVKDTFWGSVDKTIGALDSRSPGALRFLFIDANGRTRADGRGHIGEEDGEAINDNGERLIHLLRGAGMVAFNTHWQCGYTWRSAHGPTARIDYVCGPGDLMKQVVACDIPGDVDLSLTTKEDHRAVRARLLIDRPGPAPAERTAAVKPNKVNLTVPWRVEAFQSMMWRYAPPVGCSIDDHVADLAAYIKASAISAFGSAADRPRKPWIGPLTWSVVKLIAPIRRCSYQARAAATDAWKRTILVAWAATRSAHFVPSNAPTGAVPAPSCHIGWAAACRLPALRREWLLWRRVSSMAWRACSRLQQSVKPHIDADRAAFLEEKAIEAQRAARVGDWRTTFAIVRSLSGRRPAQRKQQVRKKCGELTVNEEERQARWQQHFTDVFGGTEVDKQVLRDQRVPPPVLSSDLVVSPTSTAAALTRLGCNKGVGPDGVQAEFLRAGADALAVRVADAYGRVAATEQWPVAWTGGTIVDVHKAKGPDDDCDESRGIILEDHLAKGLKELIAPYVTPAYTQSMPVDQYGATAGRGTDIASHVVRSFLDTCAAKATSHFVLFIDLVKAFDRIIREIVLGWPGDVDDPSAYLASLGLDAEQREWLAGYVARHGCLLEQWGVDAKVIALLRNLHAKSWFSYGDLATAISVRVGGRQGCKYGATIFNSSYAVALMMMRDALLEAGIVMRLAPGTSEFWCDDGPAAEHGDDGDEARSVPVVDAAFVDDECLMLTAASPALLDTAVDALLAIVHRIYKLLRLEVNWKPGKTECFLHYRGRGAARRLQERRAGPDGSLVVAVPGTAFTIKIVDRYRHLGGVVCADRSVTADAQSKQRAAMAAYGPLAAKILASPRIDRDIKFNLMWSLVMSRLLFNAHVVVPTRRYLMTLNGVYMRGIRIISGCCRFGRAVTDAEARHSCGMPSIDCIVARARMRYIARLARTRPVTLLALLSSRPAGKPLPWVDLVVNDMTMMRGTVSACAALPHPGTDPRAWAEFMLEPAPWSRAVASLHYDASVCDAAPALRGEATNPFACEQCGARFATSRAALQHARRKHGVRVPQREFAHADAVCLVCGTQFGTRLRLLRHMCASRRSKCWDAIARNPAAFERVKPEDLVELDLADRASRRDAWRNGHSQPLASGPARTAAGKLIGNVRL